MGIQKPVVALIALSFIAATALELKRVRAVQQRARNMLHPGDSREIIRLVTELRSYDDAESRDLAGQLENLLKSRDRRAWARSLRRSAS